MKNKKPSIIYYICMFLTYAMQMIGILTFIAFYPLFVVLDVVMLLATFNYCCTKEDLIFWLTSFAIKFHIGTLCPQ
jgi:hypothetical protein